MANMMLARVPPEELANRGQVIEIVNKISDFSRFEDIIAADLGKLPEVKIPQQWRQAPVGIKLRFHRIEAQPGIPSLEGSVSTTVVLVCQRCLGPVELALDIELKLLLPQPGVTPAEYEGFEVWEFDENDVRPVDIVEEALIMALPFSALHHSSDDCVRIAEPKAADESRKTRPFEDLQSLMAKTGQDN
jgi:uncharacterized protein